MSWVRVMVVNSAELVQTGAAGSVIVALYGPMPGPPFPLSIV